MVDHEILFRKLYNCEIREMHFLGLNVTFYPQNKFLKFIAHLNSTCRRFRQEVTSELHTPEKLSRKLIKLESNSLMLFLKTLKMKKTPSFYNLFKRDSREFCLHWASSWHITGRLCFNAVPEKPQAVQGMNVCIFLNL